jgi:serine/threonine-protein kinase RsbW
MVGRSFGLDSGTARASEFGMLLSQVCRELGLSQDVGNSLALCATEAVNNVLEHAYGNQSGKPIVVDLTVECNCVSLSVTDWGHLMPEGRLASAVMPEPDPAEPSTWAERGRGLALMKELMDEVSYVAGVGGNVIRMRKQLQPPSNVDGGAATKPTGSDSLG